MSEIDTIEKPDDMELNNQNETLAEQCTDTETCGTKPYSKDTPSSENQTFWGENPNVLLNLQHITEIFPTEDMSFARKLNAITRLVLFVALFVFIYTRSIQSIFITVFTLFSIYLVFQYDQKEKQKTQVKKQFQQENFSSLVDDTLKEDPDIKIPSTIFQSPEPENPFSNVLLTDYDYNVNKKPAPPIFNERVNTDILAQAKQFVRNANPDQPEIADKLFMDLGEQFNFEQSMRPFYSTPNTTIPNDQQAFADFCYGSMISCKEGNKFACARNLARYTN
jgi:positive regulator of sigma E activity